MADHLPPVPEHDPLGDRLRSTLGAERADIDRKYNAVQPQRTWWKASTAWVPMAVAAVALTIAGFAFFGDRSGDNSVNVDFAAQDGEADWEVPQPEIPGPTPVGRPTAVPLPAFPAQPGFPEIFPAEVGTNWCNDWDPTLVIAWQPKQNGEPVPAQSQAEASGLGYVTRQIAVGTRLTPVVGCTAAGTSEGPMQWHAIEGLPGQPVEWINNQYLISEAAYEQWLADGTTPPESPRPPNTGTAVPVPFPGPTLPPNVLNGCGTQASLFPLRFVWNIAANDPDGGLVAHTEPGIDAPVTRVLKLDEIVVLTGACEPYEPDQVWLQLQADDGSVDWASAKYIAEPAPACLFGEQFGTRTRNSEQLTYNVQAGDTLGLVAERFGIALEELLAANPQLDPSSLSVNDPIWIPGLVPGPEPIVGPVEGLAVRDGDRTAFAPVDSQTYRWYPSDGVAVGQPCSGQPTSPGGQEEPFFHTIQPGDRLGSIAEMYNVTVDVIIRANPQMDPNIIVAGERLLIPGAATDSFIPGASDSFANIACNATDSDVQVGTTERGSANSDATHVHNLRAEQGRTPMGPCTRIVIEFGTDADSESADQAASRLPLMTIEKQADSTRIVLPQGTFNGPNEPKRLSSEAGEVLLSLTSELRPAIEVLYRQPAPVNVWFLENPARVIIDYLNPPSIPSFFAVGPYGQHFILRDPIQSVLTGPGVLEGEPISVTGFGRPFEGQGLYRLYQVDPAVDPNEHLATNPEPMIEAPFFAIGSGGGWGEFRVDLPVLEPGTYIAVFGEVPPTDEIEFIGTGQMFRVYAADAPQTKDFPPAELLPNLRIAGGETGLDTPAARGPGDRPLEHVIQVGDFISAIAQRYNLTVQEIVLANRLENGGNNLQVGQVLLIPPPLSAGG